MQGPLGPFFNRLSNDLRGGGATVFKINFNAGDFIFYPMKSVCYRDSIKNWPAFLQQYVIENRIDSIYLFGDCRPIHLCVKEIAGAYGIAVGVFEEGYVRPDYITFEFQGVNGHSTLPNNSDFYRSASENSVPKHGKIGNPFWITAMWAFLYYLATIVAHGYFKNYVHHRNISLTECIPWIKSAYRKIYYRFKERKIQENLVHNFSKQYYLVPLQVHNDAQIGVHSTHENVKNFISSTMISFADNAPADTILVIKHHPLDRGYRDYTNTIASLTLKLNLQGRILYIHDQHLPTLLQHARGVVMINSTVGLSSLHHGTPTIVTGEAIYDMKGLTYQGRLDKFWGVAQNEIVDKCLFNKFREYIISKTQINGNFYRRLPMEGSDAGLPWFEPPKEIVQKGLLPIEANSHSSMRKPISVRDRQWRNISMADAIRVLDSESVAAK